MFLISWENVERFVERSAMFFVGPEIEFEIFGRDWGMDTVDSYWLYPVMTNTVNLTIGCIPAVNSVYL